MYILDVKLGSLTWRLKLVDPFLELALCGQFKNCICGDFTVNFFFFQYQVLLRGWNIYKKQVK